MPTSLPADFCPYKGLQPYTEQDRAFFFGRERDQQIIISNLYAAQLTVLYGASGVGKSSVLLAGSVPLLRKERNLAVVVFRNWQDANFLAELKKKTLESINQVAAREIEIDLSLALDEFLAQATRALRGPIFFIFDQFEEYFLYNPGSSDADGFEPEFARAVNRRDVAVNFLLSMREDGLSKLDRFQGRIPTLLNNMLRLEHLDRQAARDAIIKPLDEYNRQLAGVNPITIENSLVEAVLNDLSNARVISEQTGQGQVSLKSEAGPAAPIETPFLQVVMMRLWDEERVSGSRVLRLQTFEALGRAENIARTHLDTVMGKLTAAELDIAAEVLRYLVTPAGTKIAQEPGALVSWTELKEDQVSLILQRLSAPDMRILRVVQVPGQPARYEIFHDVLAQAILNWRTRYVLEQKKLEAEKQLAAERAQAAEDLAHARQRSRRLVSIMIGLSFVVVAMIALAGYAWKQKHRANAATENTSRSLTEWAKSQLDTDPQLSLLVAYRAVSVSPSKEAVEVLKEALRRSHMVAELEDTKMEWVRGVAFSPDGKYVATASFDKIARVWDAKKGTKLVELVGHKGELASVAFSLDGNFLVTAGFDGSARVWKDWMTGSPQVIAQVGNSRGALWRAGFSPDGKYLATAGDAGVAIWDLSKTTSPLKQLPKPAGQTHSTVYSVTFSPDGKFIAVGGVEDASTSLWEWQAPLRPGENPRESHFIHGDIYGLDFSADGKLLVTGSEHGTANIFDLNLEPQGQELRPENPVWGAAFDPTGKYVATATDDGLVRLWEWRTNNRPVELLGHTAGVYCVAFSRDGQFLVSGARDGTARVWKKEIDPAEAEGTTAQLLQRARDRGASYRDLKLSDEERHWQ